MSNRSSLAVYQVENAVKVSSALSAYLNGQFGAILELCAKDVVWRSVAEPRHASFGGTFIGVDEVQRYFETLFSTYDISQPRVVDVIPAGDEVLHVLKLDAAKKDGTAFGAAFIVGRWLFKGGRVVAYTDYFDVRASLQTSSFNLPPSHELVTRDPSYNVYQNENAVLVSEILSAYRRGDTKPIFDHLHPDVVWRSLSEPDHAMFGGTFRGREDVKAYFRRLSDMLVLDDYCVIDVIPAGGETVHVAEVSAHSVADPAIKVFVRLVVFWTFQNGLITSITEYFDIPSFLSQLQRRV